MQLTRPSRSFVLLTMLMAVLVAARVLVPGVVGDIAYLLGIWIAPVVAWLGTARAGPGERLVPASLAAALTAASIGHLLWQVYAWTGRDPEVSLADLAFVAGYLGLGVALTLVTLVGRGRAARADVDALIDALTVVVVTVTVFWGISIHGIVEDSPVAPLTRVVLAFYPLADAVLLVLALRARSARLTREPLGASFTVGVGCWLVSDFGYMLVTVSGGWFAFLDAGWMVGGVLMATSIWRGETSPVPEGATGAAAPSSLRKLGIAILPLFVPPAFIIVNALSGHHVHPVHSAVEMTLLAAFAFVRTARLLRSESRARTELAEARDLALAGSQAKSAFLATMSHEVRTPMNGVLGLTGLLLTTELDERQRQYAQGLRSAGDNLLTVINDVLDFSKVEAGRLELETIDFDLVRVVEEVAELVAESAQEKGLELLAYCSPELPAGLRGDPHRLRQVLLNLAGNAVKFTASGEVVVRAELEEQTFAGVVVRFEVADTGIGIATEDRPRLFEAFSQVDSSTTRRYGGTGLGLAICRELVTAMGGTIGVDSRPDHGSTFWFTLPLEPAADPAIGPPRSTELLSGLRALVVDDNRTNRMILHDQLSAWGISVEAVDSGARALSLLDEATRASRPFDLAVLDLRMPSMDGLELARRVSAAPDLASTGLVLLTSGPDVSQAEARAAGIAASLTKPVQLSRLRGTLEDLAGSTRVSPGTPAEPAGTHRGRVLVVEDDEINQLVATGVLEHLGYTVDCVGDGIEALDALERASYVAVLMDVQMPRLDGYQATAEIRRREAGGPRTPIIAMTAGAIAGDRERCLAAGMDDYVSKPISKEVVAAVINRWVPAR
ncbi:response regulator [Nocardioides pyridinolyticus]